MPLETTTYIHQLNPANPSGSDRLQQGDDHIRLLKAALKATFPNIEGPVNLTHQFLNGLVNAALPVGAIMLWSGATAPSGWALCHGQTVSRSDGGGSITLPDLRNRVPVGAGPAHPLGSQFGQEEKTVTSEVGGAHSHSATIAASGAHSHSVSLTGTSGTTAAQVNVTTSSRVVDGSGGSQALSSASATSPAHSHSVSLSGTTGVTGSAHTHPVAVSDHTGHGHAVKVNVAQPSHSINFIMKI